MEVELETEKKRILGKNLTDEEINKACEKMLEAIRCDDIKKIKRYINRYGNDLVKVSTG